jgi:methylmalonyl-CoA mutase, N-terminal domain
VTNTIDPLGGSYFVEALTNETEQRAEEYFARIDDMGKGSILEGMLAGIERGFFQSEIADAAFREQQRFEKGRLVKVGVNEFVDEDDQPIDVLKIGPEIEESQIASVRRMRGDRDEEAASAALEGLKSAAADESENLMPPLIDCARSYCTEGEIVGALREVFGEYVETPRF